jgi:hypothetical protein
LVEVKKLGSGSGSGIGTTDGTTIGRLITIVTVTTITISGTGIKTLIAWGSGWWGLTVGAGRVATIGTVS